ncbi:MULTISPECIES: cytochrome c3 family protein [Pseudomonas]|uniref:cytochrome c3 family protein n=1 Tax=Pseudomonas TaxID=286 RepID=UPI0015E47177|nr:MULTISPECIES: cytochrome c3 family protein [Pseudomonas]MBA1242170.1 cytochrome c3 family protein [Pseudomonas japonica]MBA1288483.1 cytochrome c3 family protein [Pseudomonas japonica]
MGQIFSRGADLWLRLGLLGLFGGLATVFLCATLLARSDYATLRGWTIDQPVPFSHQHHVGGLKLDCQYCHTSVATSAQATLPPTETCMTCHSQVWTNADLLEPLRQSLTRNQPLHWNRVAQLPDYVYFHHDVHVTAGVGCVECHGRVDTMPLMRRAEPFQMQWCVDCHRDPAPRLRPREAVTQMDWQTREDRRELGQRLLREYHIDTRDLTSCSVCHR